MPLLLLLGITTAVLLSPLLHRRAMATWYRQRRWRDEMAWPTAVRELGLTEEEIRAGHEVGRARGTVDGVPIELVVSVRLFGFALRHEFRVPLANDPGFSARRRARDSNAGDLSGDPDLDAAIRFQADDAEHLRLTCDAVTRASLHETVGRGAVLSDGELVLVLTGLPSEEGPKNAGGLVLAVRSLARCVSVLGRSWKPRERLLAALDDPEWTVRLRTLRSLIDSGDAHLEQALTTGHEDEVPAIRLVAALASTDGRDALEALHDARDLVDLVQQPDPEVREAAARAYERVGTLKDVDLLLDVARRPRSSGQARAAIEDAIEAIRSRSPGEAGRLALEAPETGTLSLVSCR